MDLPDPIDIEVGARVKLRRTAAGLSQSQLAEGIGVTFQQVQKYERGTNRISASMLVKIAGKLGTSVADLVGEADAQRHSHSAYANLAVPGGVDLLEAYASLKDPEVRRAVISLVKSFVASKKR